MGTIILIVSYMRGLMVIYIAFVTKNMKINGYYDLYINIEKLFSDKTNINIKFCNFNIILRCYYNE